MASNHHNITGPSPTARKLLEFALFHNSEVTFRKRSIPNVASASIQVTCREHEARLLKQLTLSTWAFEHRPIDDMQGEFHVLVSLNEGQK